MHRVRWFVGGVLAASAVLLAGCGGSGSTHSTTSRPATPAASSSASSVAPASGGSGGGLTQAQFDALDPCSVLTVSEMASLVGGPLSGAPQSSNGPGPHECQFASDTSTRECPGSIEISYFPRGSGQTAKEWIDGNENGYHPQPESGLGDYAVFDATLKETSAAKGPIAIVVAASCGGSTTAQVESLQAQAVTAAFTKLPS